MGREMVPWDEGFPAWRRLTKWRPASPPAGRQANDGDGALQALSDIRVLGYLLSQAELMAVRTARRHGKTWAEIATRLGITRQSAWERWRDLDDTAQVTAQEPAASAETGGQGRPGVEGAIAGVSGDLVQDAAESWGRQKRQVIVPDVIGMSWDDAHHVLQGARLVAAGPDPDGPPLGAFGWPGGVVVNQNPPAGATLQPGSTVTLWIERGGGGAGVREPRRPGPAHGLAAGFQDDTAGEAVG